VPDLEGFLQAALLVPRSLTADFNFPGWHDDRQHAPRKRAREVLPTVGAT
jgi:hypothetical protein